MVPALKYHYFNAMAKSRRSIQIPTPDDLAKAALRYLARYAASEASLRRTLDNRLRRAAMVHESFAEDAEMQSRLYAAVEDIIARHKKSGVLNDAVFAEVKVNSLRRAGKSAYAIRQKLGLKGVAKATIEKALLQNDDGVDPRDSERKAALALAKKRRLGPFRIGATSLEQQKKDLATLARAGFSLDIARNVLNSTVDEFD
jgi:regulatory protein